MTRLHRDPDLFAPGNPFRRFADNWQRFWFQPSDPTTLGLIRLCCGLLVLYIHLAYTYDLYAFFGPHAWLDLPTATAYRLETPGFTLPFTWDTQLVNAFQGQWIWSIFFHLADPFWIGVVHGVVLLIMLLFALGLCTRVTAVLTWAAMLTYIQRSPTTLFGMDTILIVVVTYLMLGPSGSALSVDRLLRCWYHRRRQGKDSAVPVPDFWTPAPRVSATVALRLIQIHVCLIYLASGLSKLQGPTWWTGNAVWGTMVNWEFSPLGYQLYLEAMRFLAERRWLWEVVTTTVSYGTVIFEVSFICLVWLRSFRWFMIVGAVLLHTGIAFFMGLVAFSCIMLIAVLSFIPAEVVRQLLRRGTGMVSGWFPHRAVPPPSPEGVAA